MLVDEVHFVSASSAVRKGAGSLLTYVGSIESRRVWRSTARWSLLSVAAVFPRETQRRPLTRLRLPGRGRLTGGSTSQGRHGAR